MVVLLPNTVLGVRRRIDQAEPDAYGETLVAGWGTMFGPHDGRTKEQADGTWTLALDMALWPIRQGDLIVGENGATWLVTSCDPVTNSWDDYVNYARVVGQRRTAGGTAPPDGWFVARYTDSVQPTPLTTPAAVHTGHGPPPDTLEAAIGDEYIDLDTGTIYGFGETP